MLERPELEERRDLGGLEEVTEIGRGCRGLEEVTEIGRGV